VIGDRVLEIHDGSHLVLEDLTVTGGAEIGGAGIQVRGGDITTTRVVIDGNNATDRGGGIFLDAPGSFTGTDTVFSNNIATNSGGGLNVAGGSITAVNVSFTDNVATVDAGAGVRASGGPFNFTGGTWSGNSSQRIGGTASFVGTPTITITNVTATNNEAKTEDGGALSTDGGSLSVSGSSFSNNTAKRSGGAIYVNGGTVSIEDSSFSSNEVTDSSGGAVWLNVSTTLTVSGSTFEGNSAGSSGGAVRQLGGTTSIEASLFNLNIAGIYGGAISSSTSSSLDVVNTTIVFNEAGTSGGGIKSGEVEIVFSTIASNTASSFGSNIRATSLSAKSSVSAYGKIVDECRIDGLVTTNGAVFGGDASCFGAAKGDPKLNPLADNGGPTRTRLVAIDSPLVNAGAAVAGVSVDQRGVTRPEGSSVDIGAVELQSPVAVNDTKTTDEGKAVTVSVLSNDVDPDGVIDSASVVTTSGPAHGSTTDNGNGTITYTPNPGYFGNDAFNYGFNAGMPLADGAKVTITVNSVGSRFIDTGSSIFEKEIEWLAEVGITKGCNPPDNTMFCPTADVTRGQMAAFLNRAFNLPATSTDFFTDDDDSVFEGDINRLAAAGITKGCNPPTSDMFCPDGKVTRGQMAAFLVRAYGYTAGAGANLFIDDDDSIFENDIDRLGTAGVTRGCNPPTNSMFCPDSRVTREQMAAFLYRAEH
jgi:predicted outer membrane repeat protein